MHECYDLDRFVDSPPGAAFDVVDIPQRASQDKETNIMPLGIDCCNGEPEVLVHYVALIGNQGIVRITQCRWRRDPLVKQ